MQTKKTAGMDAAFMQGLQVTAVTIHLVLPVLILLAGAFAHYAGWIS